MSGVNTSDAMGSGKRKLAYQRESDPLRLPEWQFDKTPEAEQIWPGTKVEEIKGGIPSPK